MSKYQINTIKEVMGFSTEDAEVLIQMMDSTGDHPDWSESTTRELRSHFKSILAGE